VTETGTAQPGAPTAFDSHRPALDGVRAVAVLAVIAYHVGSRLPGGFLGVDVFFVLSGYLITTLLLRERLRLGRIDLAGFWSRRARRLLPAVLILVAVCALMTAHFGAIGSYDARRQDMLATIFYYANWHFIAEGASYFAQFTGTSPLQHTWSLAIEEQFYLLWPLVVLGVGLFRGWSTRVLWGVVVVGTLASAGWLIASYDPADPTRVYFGTDTRAHELFIGAGLAALLLNRPQLIGSKWMATAARWAWPAIAVLFAVAFVVMHDQSGFYYRGGSLAFALLVAAALLLVETAPGSVLGRLLSLRAVVWVGTISYGLYLWHWPLIVWVGGSSTVPDENVKQLLEVVLTFAIATASYYLVERRIRDGRMPWLGLSRERLAKGGVVAALAVAVIALEATSVGTNPIVRQLTDIGGSDCPAGSPAPVPTFAWCTRVQPQRPGASVVGVVGDSTALALNAGMAQLAGEHGWGYVQAGKNGCSVLPLQFPTGRSPAAITAAETCVGAVPKVLDDVRARAHPDVWVVSDRWSLLPMREPSGRFLQPGERRRRQIIQAEWIKRLRELTARGAKVILMITPPPAPPIECATTSPPPDRCSSTSFTTADAQTVAGRRIVKAAAAKVPGVVAVSVDDLVCPDHGRCPAVVGGVLTRYDGIHYTATFSTRILRAVFARAERAGLKLTPPVA
jgi:peptidoglycan/LPS O-acetylase OafA/YrhL